MIWLMLILALLVSFTFSGIESGVLSVNRVRLRHFARRGEEAAVQLDTLLGRIERLVTTVVIITNAANVVAVTILYMKFTEWLGSRAGALVALLIALPLFVFCLEFLPKSIFRRFPYRTLVVFAKILATASAVLSPIVNVGAWVLRPLLRIGRERESGRIVSVEDLKRVTAESAEKGQLTEAERVLIGNVVDFRTIRAAEMLRPIEDDARVAPEMFISDLLAQSQPGDRYLVVDHDGVVRGLIRIADLLFDGVRTGRVQSYLRRVVTIGEHETAMSALRKLRAARLPVAVVNSASGVPRGTLSSERLIEGLLGGGKKRIATG